MPAPSSPIAYPPSSSPPFAKAKSLRKVVEARKGRTIGGFLQDDSSDEEHGQTATHVSHIKRPVSNGKPSIITPTGDANKENEVRSSNIFRPRTTGGFLDDDDDDDGEEISISRLPEPRAHPLKSIFESELMAQPDPPVDYSFLRKSNSTAKEIKTCSGNRFAVKFKNKSAAMPYEQMVAARSTTKAGRATKSYYGIDIQQLVGEASQEIAQKQTEREHADSHMPLPSIENQSSRRKGRTLMWTEKYRARKFTDLVGDDRTHRQVLRWLKAWDPIVFPNSEKTGAFKKWQQKKDGEEKPHRKILLLTGPPGLGKTTLAHVCARQAGYDVMEINASDERSKDVVKGRIRDSVGTESVKNVGSTTKNGDVQNAARPVCVVVDEVDGVVGGSGGSGEGGFVKALIDLVLLDQKNTAALSNGNGASPANRKKKGDNFRLLRPLILICNDVYHPSLRQLRQSNHAEIIHIRKPPLDAVIARMKSVFEKEGVTADIDGVRRLCEATWGVSRDIATETSGAGEGDLRGIMVVGEWVAGKLKSSSSGQARLTRKWVEDNMISDLSHGGGGARSLGRGGPKEIVQRVFLEGAGFPKPSLKPVDFKASFNEPKAKLGVAEIGRRAAMDRLREMVDTSGDTDRIVTDLFSEYPSQPFQDDTLLSKPNSGYEWLHFHDSCSSRVFTGQEWELSAYLSLPVLAYHHLFSSPKRHYAFAATDEKKKWNEDDSEEVALPFSGPRASFEAFETEKLNRATLSELQSSLNPTLLRSFRSPEDIAVDLVPYLNRMMAPEIKPVVVGGSGDQKGIASVRRESEKDMVRRAVNVMSGVGVIFERGKLESTDFSSRATQWVYRMEP
jgi:chromosome transmission fidelity protein 18